MKKFLLLAPILLLVFASGCVQQSSLERGIDISLKAEQGRVFASKDTTLYIDVENKDEHAYWKVFVDVFDAGLFSTERILPESGTIGSLAVHAKKNCTKSVECYDEDYGGCGVCYNGGCVSSQRAQSAGMSCDKTCQCTPNSGLVCKEGSCGRAVDKNGQQLKCRGGTEYNKCGGYDSTGTQAYFCDEYGESYSQCQGPDQIVGYDDVTGKDDCGCLSGVCRGDGTCGTMQQCFANIYDLAPNEIKTIECKLTAPSSEQLPKQSISSNVNVRLRFSNKLSALPTIEMISEEEYKWREYSNKVTFMPVSYTYNDKAIQVAVSFSKDFPIVVRSGEKVYMYIDIKDVSDGMIYSIRQNDFHIIQDGSVIGKCDNEGIVLRPDGKTFPKITCELNLPKEINYLSNYAAIINIDYSYEYRKSIPVEIVK
ncbi:MAG: hypothetical protein HZB67_01820 [Candidatus Aenigmarchaeota archaeon]|nr:hypothetical protein [Candidatus Aenigmarchaeota archaeon]